jgi:hypothetical protein
LKGEKEGRKNTDMKERDKRKSGKGRETNEGDEGGKLIK